MSAGLKEIVILVVVVLALFLAPRMMKRGSAAASSGGGSAPANNKKTIGYLRLALFVSILWIVAGALLLKPWEGNLSLFATVGLGPVALGWGIRWVAQGFK